MKRYIMILLCAICIFMQMAAQQVEPTNIPLHTSMHHQYNAIECYHHAIEYVKADLKIKNIYVSPYFEYLDWYHFPLDSLNDMPDKKDTIESIVEKTKFVIPNDVLEEFGDGKYSDELANFTGTLKKATNMLFFTKMKDGMFIVSCIPVPFYIKKSKKYQQRKFRFKEVAFGTSTVYLFVYDDNCQLKKVLKQQIQYN